VKIDVGKFLGRIVPQADPIELWLRRLLTTALAQIGPETGAELEIGATRVKLLNERYRVRLLAERED
jgi:hypothetical protein